ncbi:hypothetical protein AWV63_18880 [Micromonospora rifamycinica]|nr:hypothetical protein AWV63_18880 [Micromonospora rifamycinica]
MQLVHDDRGVTTQGRPAESPATGQLPALLAGEQTIAISVEDGRGGYRRQYPQGRTYATVTGFTSLNEVASLDAWLRDRAATPGASDGDHAIHTTIVPAVQEVAVRELGTARGAAVAVDPATGHILAMASTPGYDPNLLADPDTASAALRSLHADATEPLSNRATTGIVAAPGEVFEVVTAAAALSNGYTADTQLPGPAVLTLPGMTTQLANRDNQACSSTGTTTLADALRTSCTTAFADLGIRLGGRTLQEQAQAFGIGRAGHIPVPVQPSVFPDVRSPHEAAWAAVGAFDVRITPLQLAMISSGIANQGKVATPTLLADHVGEPPMSPATLTATTPEVAGALAAMMRGAVVSGPARGLTIPGLPVAGLICDSPNGSAGITWATAFASTGGRSIAVAVALENHDKRTLSAQTAAVTRGLIRAGLDVNE